MNFMKIKTNDVANGEGVRVSLFTSGCEFYCKGCFNYDAWDFNSGKPFTFKDYLVIAEELKKSHIDGITFLGGEPLHPKNVDTIAKIILNIKKEFPDKTIWVYSGYTFEALLERMCDEFAVNYIINNTDVLVDGLFIDELKDPSLAFRGSSNQRVLRLSERSKQRLTPNDNYSGLVNLEELQETQFSFSTPASSVEQYEDIEYEKDKSVKYNEDKFKDEISDIEELEETSIDSSKSIDQASHNTLDDKDKKVYTDIDNKNDISEIDAFFDDDSDDEPQEKKESTLLPKEDEDILID